MWKILSYFYVYKCQELAKVAKKIGQLRELKIRPNRTRISQSGLGKRTKRTRKMTKRTNN